MEIHEFQRPGVQGGMAPPSGLATWFSTSRQRGGRTECNGTHGTTMRQPRGSRVDPASSNQPAEPTVNRWLLSCLWMLNIGEYWLTIMVNVQ